jgi:hypothetical protein
LVAPALPFAAGRDCDVACYARVAFPAWRIQTEPLAALAAGSRPVAWA